MGHGRREFWKVLSDAGVGARIPLVAALSSGTGINMHSKLALFDDRWLTVGSANLNRRSMGFDVECNLVLEASTPEHRDQMRRIRAALLAEHLGTATEDVEQALRTHALSRLPDLWRHGRQLIRIEPRERAALGPLLVPIFDADEPWQARFGARAAPAALGWSTALLSAAVLLGMTLGGDGALAAW